MRYVLLHASSFAILFSRFLLESWTLRLCILHHMVWVYVAGSKKTWLGRSVGHWERVRRTSEAGLLVAFSLARLYHPLALLTLPAFRLPPRVWGHDVYELALGACLDTSPLQGALLVGAGAAARVTRRFVTNQEEMHREALRRVYSRKAQIMALATLYFGWRMRLAWYAALLALDGVVLWGAEPYTFVDWGTLPPDEPAPLRNLKVRFD